MTHDAMESEACQLCGALKSARVDANLCDISKREMLVSCGSFFNHDEQISRS
jgi:hypothetical protein